MTRRYFGTDGVRGRANASPMTPDLALKLGVAAGRIFRRGDHRHRVVIGKDTRLSGYMIEPALTAGFTAAGMDVFLFGPLPTPAVAMLTRSLRADLGVVISASHNPYHDNGVKVFGPDGFKLSDETEQAIEAFIDNGIYEGLVDSAELGRAKRIDDAGARYIEFAKNAFPRSLTLEGLRVVVDCAHGAAYKVAPSVLFELGAEVFPIGVSPDGFNINDECGSTYPKRMIEAVRDKRADLGLAFDGDADRLVLCDEKGRLVDGDQVLAVIADQWHRQNRLTGGAVVATVMSNLGLERKLTSLGLSLERTKVGDRYVVERMRALGCNLGGEQSGHIILGDYATTGDGLVAGLQVMAAMAGSGLPASEICATFEPAPQRLENVPTRPGTRPMDDPKVQAAVADAQAQLEGKGQLVVRPSGTEPLVRVMAQADDARLVDSVVDGIRAAVKEASTAS
jgi:phosphoglucosamine mutase